VGAVAVARLGTTGRVAATYLLLAGLQRGVSLLILPFITHAMSPAEYGAASMLTAASLLVVAILAGPLDTLVIRTVPRGGEDAPGLLRVAGVYCYILLPVTAALVATGFALFVPTFLDVPGSYWAIEILAIGFSSAMTMFALPMVKARQDLPRFVWLAGSSVVFVAVSKLMLLVVWQLAVVGWVISDLISALLSAAVAMALVRPPRARVTQDHVRAVARFAVPLIPHLASIWAITSLSLPALALVSTFAQVGLLSVGLSVASTASFVTFEINRAVQPRYSRETFPAPTQQTYAPVRWQIVLAAAVPAAVGAALALVGQWVFAEPYWPSFALTAVLLVAQAAFGLYPIAINYLVLTAGLPHYSALATGTGAAIILVSIFIFGRDYGAVGVAYATTAGYLAMAAVAIMLTRLTRLDISWRRWAMCWPDIAVGTAALACSVAALSCPVGSAPSRILAGGCLVLLFGAAILVTRHRPVP
jgi:O-antigen/teichoic acid export membrane protein